MKNRQRAIVERGIATMSRLREMAQQQFPTAPSQSQMTPQQFLQQFRAATPEERQQMISAVGGPDKLLALYEENNDGVQSV